MGTKRLAQVGEQIREHIALMLVKGELSDPRVRGVTINSVKMTPDLQTARVYYSVLGDESTRAAAKRGLEAAAGFIRHSLGTTLQIRYTPGVFFHFDESVERAARMSSLLSKVREEDARYAQDSTQEVEEDSSLKKEVQ